MFLKFSRMLLQLAPLFSAISYHFTDYRLRRIFYPGPCKPSLRRYFKQSGHTLLFNVYTSIQRGTFSFSELVRASQKSTGRWVYRQTMPGQQSRVEWSFVPTEDERARGYIAVEGGQMVSLHGFDEQGHANISTKSGRDGKVPGCYIKERGGWEVEYDDNEPAASSCSSGELDICGIDTACAAAMRACSSGQLSALTLQLCWDFGSSVRDRNKEFKMNRLVLSRVCMGRMTSIIKVSSALIPRLFFSAFKYSSPHTSPKSCTNPPPPPPFPLPQLAAAGPVFHFINNRSFPFPILSLCLAPIAARLTRHSTFSDPTFGRLFGETTCCKLLPASTPANSTSAATTRVLKRWSLLPHRRATTTIYWSPVRLFSKMAGD
jgi:hypothetical protein